LGAKVKRETHDISSNLQIKFFSRLSSVLRDSRFTFCPSLRRYNFVYEKIANCLGFYYAYRPVSKISNDSLQSNIPLKLERLKVDDGDHLGETMDDINEAGKKDKETEPRVSRRKFISETMTGATAAAVLGARNASAADNADVKPIKIPMNSRRPPKPLRPRPFSR
jgi:hypothetical protein